jgi:hypothetical protein
LLGLVIGFLLSGVIDTQEASSKSARDQQAVQVEQGDDAELGRAKLHARARRTVQHPNRQDDDYAGRSLNPDDITSGAFLADQLPKPTPV